MLTIIREWSKNDNDDKTSNKLSTLIDSIEPDTIEISNFQEQKDIFYNKLQKQTVESQRFVVIFAKIEQEINDNDRILYLYLLLNHIPFALIFDSLNQAHDNPSAEDIENLIDLSMKKFKVNV
jgi:hypothetical protein